ncbi:hypothetical protein OQA88_10978 [Cercophora sp. LCS_1]
MDPATIIGTIGAVAGTLDVLAKIIRFMSDLRSRWMTSDIVLTTFEAQVVAVNSALLSVDEWVQTTNPESYPQLLRGVDLCVAQCATLADAIDLELASLQALGTDKPRVVAKARRLLKTREMSEIKRRITEKTHLLRKRYGKSKRTTHRCAL